jgi:hypothetical protein
MFKQPIGFMENQFKILRDNIYFEDYRGPQPLYNRTVYRNFINETLSSIPDYNRCLLDFQNEKIQDKSTIFGIINCPSYSFLLLSFIFYSALICLVFVFCKVRYSNGRKKFE